MTFEWKDIQNFDDFLSEFKRYIRTYFKKRVILTNSLKLETVGDTVYFMLDTASTDIVVKIFKPDRVLLFIYIVAGRNYMYGDWNGLILTEKQYRKFMNLAREVYDYYQRRRRDFSGARAEAFVNLIRATGGQAAISFIKALADAYEQGGMSGGDETD